MDIQQLASELQNDPAGLGYAAFINDRADYDVAMLLNGVQPGETVYAPTISALQLQDCLDPGEFTKMDAVAVTQLQFLQSAGSVNTGSAKVRGILDTLFASMPVTAAALAALIQRTATRAEVLFGVGVAVTPSDISRVYAADRQAEKNAQQAKFQVVLQAVDAALAVDGAYIALTAAEKDAARQDALKSAWEASPDNAASVGSVVAEEIQP